VTNIEDAVELALRGYYLAPVTVKRNPATGRKMPIYHGQWAELSSNDPADIRRWADALGRDVGFCIDCQKTGIVVVDLDVKPSVNAVVWWSSASLPISPYRVETPSGGLHLYWRQRPGDPVANSQGKIAPGVDVRGRGGHVFAPGTYVVGAPEQPWTALDQIPDVADLPTLPKEVFEAIPVDARKVRRNEGGYAHGATHERWWVERTMRAQLALVAEHLPEPGTGFRAVLRGASIVHGRGVVAGLIERADAEHELRAAVEACWGFVDDEDGKWIETGLDDGETDPWTVLETGDEPTDAGDEVAPSKAEIVESWAPEDLLARLDGTHKRARARLLSRNSHEVTERKSDR
jgi:hypothetical protein